MTENILLQEQPQNDTLPETETVTQTEETAQPEDGAILAEDSVLEVPVCPEFETEDTAKTKKRRVWGAFLSAYFVLLVAAAAVGVWFFYNYLQRYESVTPAYALENYMQWVRDRNYTEIYKASDFEETVLNTEDEFFKYLDSVFQGDISTLTVREKATSTEERKDYSLYIEDKRVCGLTLIKNPEWAETAWNYVTEIHYRPEFSIYASEDIRLTVNGVSLSILNPPSAEAQETVLSGSKTPEGLPKIMCYTIGEMLNPPTIEALTLSGDVCEVIQAEDGSYYVHTPASEFLRAENEELARNAAFKYAEFIARDTTRAAVLKLVYKNSELYDTIQNFSNYWFTAHDSYEFTDVAVSEYVQYTSTDFACNVTFKPVYTRKNKPIETAPVNYRLTFIMVDEEWKLMSLAQVAVDNDSAESPASATTP